jgi:hypothetical protein
MYPALSFAFFTKRMQALLGIGRIGARLFNPGKRIVFLPLYFGPCWCAATA